MTSSSLEELPHVESSSFISRQVFAVAVHQREKQCLLLSAFRDQGFGKDSRVECWNCSWVFWVVTIRCWFCDYSCDWFNHQLMMCCIIIIICERERVRCVSFLFVFSIERSASSSNHASPSCRVVCRIATEKFSRYFCHSQRDWASLAVVRLPKPE